jgi:hypothetical protein
MRPRANIVSFSREKIITGHGVDDPSGVSLFAFACNNLATRMKEITASTCSSAAGTVWTERPGGGRQDESGCRLMREVRQ